MTMKRKIWAIVLVAWGTSHTAWGDDSAKSKRTRLSSGPAEQPITIDVRRLGWDVYQPFWSPEVQDLTVESFDFDDKSSLERITKLRSLSLVTFAETNNTRLFLGVNKEGMVGLHFSAFPRYGKDRHLSLWSMPYVSKTEKPLVSDGDLAVRLLKDTQTQESSESTHKAQE